MEEIWKDIPGYEGKYQASSRGRVRSMDRYIVRPHPRSKAPTEYHVRGRVLKRTVGAHGYCVVGLGKENVQKVHVIVAATFLGRRPSGKVIRHLDGNRQNNSISNLCYGTQSENQMDRYSYGGKMGKLSPSNVRQIRNLLVEGSMGRKDVAELFGVTRGAVDHICQGRTFAWLK
ncbi:MAG: NUMOD4 motif-containing HNH endonuclease [Lachnospiraceae bacterium]